MINRDRHLFSISIQRLLFLALSSLLIEGVEPVFAQIKADQTLGTENSVVNQDVIIKGIQSDRIDGGAKRGANLFHSFSQFIIPEGRGAYFSNPDGISTIFSRVTGGNGSQILGTLGVLGEANLFLIDPKGIIFGANAKLDISGSFIANTANSIVFPNGENFSASNPNAAPLLAIDVPVPVGLVFESDNSGIILNVADLKNQQNLALVAGGILSGGQLTAPGGNITLATVPGAINSVVGLDGTGKFLGTIPGTGQPNLEGRDIVLIGGAIDASSNSIAGNVVLNSAGDTLLSNGATVNVRGAGGGSITVNAQNLGMSGGSQLLAGIRSGLGSPQAQARNVTLNVADEIALSQTSSIENRVNQNAIGNAGNIVINTGSLYLSNDAQLITSTQAQGNAGKIQVNASDTVNLSSRASVESSTAGLQSGNAGDIFIKARSLSVTDGATLNASTFGQGNGGNITLRIDENVTFDNANAASLVFLGTGTGGSIDIQTRDFSLSNGAIISTITLGAGTGGSIDIQVRSLSLSNGASISTTTAGAGTGGNLSINADQSVQLTGTSANGRLTSIVTGTNGKEDAGDLEINTGQLLVSDRAGIATTTLGEGKGGNIRINASDSVQVIGSSATNTSFGIETGTTGKGDSGNLEINTGRLLIHDRAGISTTTLGEGKGGNIRINASDSVQVIGSSANDTFTGIVTGTNGKGDAGDLEINTGQLLVRDRAGILTTTLGEGKGGNLNINADQSVQVIGSSTNDTFTGIVTGTNGKGDAGDLEITTGHLLVRDGARIATDTNGTGSGGDLTVNASELVQLIGFAEGRPSSLTSITTGKGDAGNLEIHTGRLVVRDRAIISTTTNGEGQGGNIRINASDSVQVIGNSASGTLSSLLTGTTGKGDAGNLEINTGRLVLRDRAVISTTTNGEGKGGNLSINASDSVSLNRVGLIFSGVGEDGENNSGNIHIRARSLSLTNGSFLVAFTEGIGDAGNIDINVDKSVRVSGVITQRLTGNDFVFPSAIASSVLAGGEGQGGDISIKAESLSLNNGGLLFSNTIERGDAGNISLKVDDFVTLNNLSLIQSNVEPGGEGSGGNVNIQARSLTLKNGSSIQAGLRAANDESPGGIGQGGNINIHTSDFVEISGTNPRQVTFISPIFPENAVDPSQIQPPNLSSGLFTSTQTGASGPAGNIFVTTGAFRLADGAVVEAPTANSGRAGDITIDANTIDITGGAQIISATRGSGDAGDIMLKVKDSLTISGSDPNFEKRLAGVGGDRDRITNLGPESGLFANTDVGSTGDGGNISIQNYPKTATINDGAVVTVNSQGRGAGGEIRLQAGSLTLNNGTLSAQIDQTEENVGNIFLNVQNLLLLRNGSQNLDDGRNAWYS
ncbi:MAG: filamentous hemagglutinin N-terminal domain-containing protein [Hydrococcus sp. CRU_1_1]|nr:filamentous hemagglutinin N-terminal domain-containing protein [Hydrococcus sp. CRU_1_1]